VIRHRHARWVTGTALVLMLVGLGATAAAQTAIAPADLVGAWEGTSSGTMGDMAVKLELTFADGKFGGRAVTATMSVEIVEGRLEDGVLTLVMDAQGNVGNLVATVTAGTIEGTWRVATESGALALKRPGSSSAAGGDPLSGEWSGEVMVQGQPMAITLTLRFDGEVLTGEMQSSAGRVPLASASWKDDVLTVAFPYTGGEPVTMSGKLQDGKIAGTFDYNGGEYQGAWWVTRK
jgi:hypothetical protein